MYCISYSVYNIAALGNYCDNWTKAMAMHASETYGDSRSPVLIISTCSLVTRMSSQRTYSCRFKEKTKETRDKMVSNAF